MILQYYIEMSNELQGFMSFNRIPRRQDSVETWGNDPKRRRSQGNETEKEKMTRGKERCLISVRHVRFGRQKGKFQRKKDPNKRPGHTSGRGRPAYIRLVTFLDSRRRPPHVLPEV